jgi:hypothetical protein
VNSGKSLPAASSGVLHFIRTTGLLVSSKFPRLDWEKLMAAKKEFAKIEKERGGDTEVNDPMVIASIHGEKSR